MKHFEMLGLVEHEPRADVEFRSRESCETKATARDRILVPLCLAI
jgi:hypothetical protein